MKLNIIYIYMSYDVKKKRKHKGSKIKKSFKLIDVKKAPRKKIVKKDLSK